MAKTLSSKLGQLTRKSSSRTVEGLIDSFADKSFAILCLVLMAIPALPLPTGGISHLFELITLLIAFQMIIGRQSIWLPQRLMKRSLPDKFWSATIPALAKFIKKVEGKARPRLSPLTINPLFIRLMGGLIFILALFAFLAPPFSGLDTLPSMGVVLIALALIFEDIIFAILGAIVGAFGVGTILLLGNLAFRLI